MAVLSITKGKNIKPGLEKYASLLRWVDLSLTKVGQQNRLFAMTKLGEN